MRWNVVLLGIALLLALEAGAETLYGVGGAGSASPGVLFRVSPVTGAQTVVGQPITEAGLTGIAFDAAGVLWGSTIQGSESASTLVRIDPDSGALLQNVGPIAVGGSAPMSIGDLAIEPGTDRLWGSRSNADGANSGGQIYTIDKLTAEATLVGVAGRGSLAFAPDGTFYQGGRILGMQDVNGVTILDPEHIDDPFDAKAFDTFFDGLAVRPSDGLLFATGALPEGGGGFFSFDYAAGVKTLLAQAPAIASMSDLDFRTLPEPSASASAALALASLGWLARGRGRRA